MHNLNRVKRSTLIFCTLLTTYFILLTEMAEREECGEKNDSEERKVKF